MSERPQFGSIPEQHAFAAGSERVGQLVNTTEILAETAPGGDHDLLAIFWAYPLVDDYAAVDLNLFVCHLVLISVSIHVRDADGATRGSGLLDDAGELSTWLMNQQVVCTMACERYWE